MDENQLYRKILDVLIDKCDIVTFFFPNYGTLFRDVGFERIEDAYEFYKDGLNRQTSDFIEYKGKNSGLMNRLKSKILEQSVSIDYFGQKYNYEKEIYFLKYDSGCAGVLKEQENFDSWSYPDLPEDLFFFKNGKCVFSCITHEKIIVLYSIEENEELYELCSQLSDDYDVLSVDGERAPLINQR